MKERLVVIVGPTAVGKTALSIEMAKKFNGEIISGDSMQIYRGLDIGTAKITAEEMQGIPHHMIDIIEPDDTFSVRDFQQMVKKLITKINENGRLPILVGGTGLYITSVIRNYQFTTIGSDASFRKRMEQFADENGNVALHKKLADIDPKSSKQIHPNNRRKVIRALEIVNITGKTLDEIQAEHSEGESDYELILIGLTLPRDELYRRINERVDVMIEKGLIQEAYSLYKQNIRNTQSVQAIGYKELFLYFDNELTKDEAIELLKRNSRRYAKRQMTWFKNKLDLQWFDMSGNQNEKMEQIMAYVAGKLNEIENH